ncbi:hypothetical protein ACWGVR_26205 [Streptomyces xanthophaeus]
MTHRPAHRPARLLAPTRPPAHRPTPVPPPAGARPPATTDEPVPQPEPAVGLARFRVAAGGPVLPAASVSGSVFPSVPTRTAEESRP